MMTIGEPKMIGAVRAVKLLRRILLISFAGIPLYGRAISCPSCYGAADSPMTAGMNAAILVMLGITGVVLTLVSVFFVSLWKKTRNGTGEISADVYVDKSGWLQVNNADDEVGISSSKRST